MLRHRLLALPERVTLRLRRNLAVDASPYYVVTDECWPWSKSLFPTGYGQICWSEGGRKVTALAHRVVYEALVGPIPDGLDLDHTCHNRDESCRGGATCKHRACVNPEHLEPATNKENARRGRAGIVSGALQRAKTCCPQGHQYDSVNTFTDRRGWRSCRACSRAKVARRYRIKRDGGQF